VNYRAGGGWTKLELRGTPLLPEAKGDAWIHIRKGYVDIKALFEKLGSPSIYGPEYLTYVLWAITPEGRATNLGELVRSSDSDKSSKLDVTTELQAFGLIVTAEPYFAVVRPSDTIVMENIFRRNTDDFFGIDATVSLLKRGAYIANGPDELDSFSDIPLGLAQARNAVRIAACAGALELAPEAMQRARMLLAQAEIENADGSSRKTTTFSREAVQTAEDARLQTAQRIEEARLADDRQEALDRIAAANDKAEREAQLRAEADRARMQADSAQRLEAERRLRAEDAERQATDKAELAQQEIARTKAAAEELAAKERAERVRLEAERALMAAEAERARAESARASEEALRAAKVAEDARLAAERAELEKAQLRNDIARQLSLILETRETARGLIVSMSDVLFDTAQYSLKPGAREKLAKVSGILLSHPGLTLEVEGYTDDVGADDYNQTLSERRAMSVRDFLTQQGISPLVITARGFGESQPVASNDTPDGRMRNRRVELVVSGDAIGKPTDREIGK
jgi:outer membrane protein OmpA-like peptidoglycan-associated protein